MCVYRRWLPDGGCAPRCDRARRVGALRALRPAGRALTAHGLAVYALDSAATAGRRRAAASAASAPAGGRRRAGRRRRARPGDRATSTPASRACCSDTRWGRSSRWRRGGPRGRPRGARALRPGRRVPRPRHGRRRWTGCRGRHGRQPMDALGGYNAAVRARPHAVRLALARRGRGRQVPGRSDVWVATSADVRLHARRLRDAARRDQRGRAGALDAARLLRRGSATRWAGSPNTSKPWQRCCAAPV